MKKIAATLAAVLFFSASAAEGAAPTAANPARVVSLGFDLFDTSLDGEIRGPSQAESRRLDLVSAQFKKALVDAPQFIVVDESVVAEAAAEWRPIHKCNGCEIFLARRVGADYAAFGVVQKVSNLILSLVVVFRDARTGKIAFTASADIRGNDDKSWTNGVRWLLEHRVIPKGR